MSVNKFNKEVKLKIDGEFQTLKGGTLKKYIAGAVKGGRTITSMEEKLIKSGMQGMQWEKRKEIMKVLKEKIGAYKKPQAKPVVRKSLRALDTSGVLDVTNRAANTMSSIRSVQPQNNISNNLPERRVSALDGAQSGLAGQAGNLNRPNPLANSLPPSGNIGGGGRPLTPLQR